MLLVNNIFFYILTISHLTFYASDLQNKKQYLIRHKRSIAKCDLSEGPIQFINSFIVNLTALIRRLVICMKRFDRFEVSWQAHLEIKK